MGEILVSVICNTYNHERYIADAIDSFLMQKTDFKYEILIHDDASTDRTTEIIREYEKKHPNVIKPLYQTENQYSKGVSVTMLNGERAKGKYIAFCEGDDYWTDPYKLQKQADYMEKYPECSLCIHGGYVVNATENKILSKHRPSKSSKTFSVEEIIEGRGYLFLSNTMFFREELLKIRPHFFEIAPVGDYPTAINLSLLGTVYYIDEIMSAYRSNVSGSWTSREYSTIEKRKMHFSKIGEMLDEINEYTNGLYSRSIQRTKLHNQFNLLLLERKFEEAKTGEFKEYYRALSLKRRLQIRVSRFFPSLYSFLKVIKRRLEQWTVK